MEKRDNHSRVATLMRKCTDTAEKRENRSRVAALIGNARTAQQGSNPKAEKRENRNRVAALIRKCANNATG